MNIPSVGPLVAARRNLGYRMQRNVAVQPSHSYDQILQSLRDSRLESLALPTVTYMNNAPVSQTLFISVATKHLLKNSPCPPRLVMVPYYLARKTKFRSQCRYVDLFLREGGVARTLKVRNGFDNTNLSPSDAKQGFVESSDCEKGGHFNDVVERYRKVSLLENSGAISLPAIFSHNLHIRLQLWEKVLERHPNTVQHEPWKLFPLQLSSEGGQDNINDRGHPVRISESISLNKHIVSAESSLQAAGEDFDDLLLRVPSILFTPEVSLEADDQALSEGHIVVLDSKLAVLGQACSQIYARVCNCALPVAVDAKSTLFAHDAEFLKPQIAVPFKNLKQSIMPDCPPILAPLVPLDPVRPRSTQSQARTETQYFGRPGDDLGRSKHRKIKADLIMRTLQTNVMRTDLLRSLLRRPETEKINQHKRENQEIPLTRYSEYSNNNKRIDVPHVTSNSMGGVNWTVNSWCLPATTESSKYLSLSVPLTAYKDLNENDQRCLSQLASYQPYLAPIGSPFAKFMEVDNEFLVRCSRSGLPVFGSQNAFWMLSLAAQQRLEIDTRTVIDKVNTKNNRRPTPAAFNVSKDNSGAWSHNNVCTTADCHTHSFWCSLKALAEDQRLAQPLVEDGMAAFQLLSTKKRPPESDYGRHVLQEDLYVTIDPRQSNEFAQIKNVDSLSPVRLALTRKVFSNQIGHDLHMKISSLVRNQIAQLGVSNVILSQKIKNEKSWTLTGTYIVDQQYPLVQLRAPRGFCLPKFKVNDSTATRPFTTSSGDTTEL